MTAIIGTLLVLAGSAWAGFGLYLLTLAIASTGFRPPARQTVRERMNRLAVLVPAHNEEMLICRCVQSLLAQTYPRHLYRVIVVADNCTDGTALAATCAGAEVMIRDRPNERGKGQALRWAMDKLLAEPAPPDAVVVVDADSVASPEMLAALEGEFASGHEVVQGNYGLLAERDSPRATLVAAAFLLFHHVRFSGRARLGMPANLVGNGMLFGRSVLEHHPWDAFIGAEDLEYSMHLAAAAIRPRFAPSARVSGPGPASRRSATKQRMRWEGGRFHVVRAWLPTLLITGIRRRDLALLSTALDLATPPLGILCIGAAAGAAATGIAVLLDLAPVWALVPWAAALVAISAYVLVGLRAAEAPVSIWRVALHAPEFLVWKVATYARLIRGFDSNRWERSDRPGDALPTVDRVEIAGVPIDLVDMSTAIARLEGAIGGGRLVQVSTVNLDFLVRAQRDADVRRIFQQSGLNLADGAPIVWLGKLLGARISGRVAGADLVPALLASAARIGARVFLLGGENGAAAACGDRFAELYPGLVLAGAYEPPRTSVEKMNNADILARISEARPDLLLVAFGHPKQERWIDLHRESLGVSVAIGVGCVFDLIAGRSRRAPRWMQNVGLEWAYRLASEPRRLFRRYLIDAAWLLPITAGVLRSRLKGETQAAA